MARSLNPVKTEYRHHSPVFTTFPERQKDFYLTLIFISADPGMDLKRRRRGKIRLPRGTTALKLLKAWLIRHGNSGRPVLAGRINQVISSCYLPFCPKGTFIGSENNPRPG